MADVPPDRTCDRDTTVAQQARSSAWRSTTSACCGDEGWTPMSIDPADPSAASGVDGGPLADAPVDVAATFDGAMWRSTKIDPSFNLIGVQLPRRASRSRCTTTTCASSRSCSAANSTSIDRRAARHDAVTPHGRRRAVLRHRRRHAVHDDRRTRRARRSSSRGREPVDEARDVLARPWAGIAR